jgi:hypothetical protein
MIADQRTRSLNVPTGAIGLALIRLEHRTAGPLQAGAALVSPVLPDWMRLQES